MSHGKLLLRKILWEINEQKNYVHKFNDDNTLSLVIIVALLLTG